MKNILLLTLFSSFAFAQSGVSPGGVQTNTAGAPTSCTTASPMVVYLGNLYGCSNGSNYTLVSGSGTSNSINAVGEGVDTDPTAPAATATNYVLKSTLKVDTSQPTSITFPTTGQYERWTSVTAVGIPGAGSTLANGYWAFYCNANSSTMTFTFSGSATVNGTASIASVTLAATHGMWIASSGTGYYITGGNTCTGTSF